MGEAGGVSACDRCLRRARLVAMLAPRITGMLGTGARAPGLLALTDEALIEAAGGRCKDLVRERLARFDPAAERAGLEAAGVFAGCRHGGRYPDQLLELPDPPAALFGVGRPELLTALAETPAVAIVGTRRPSPYGTEVAYALGRGLGAAGVPVVSGLALGIDATSHRGCLDGGGAPLAVLACGPERAYPRRHRRLHEQVAERGLVVSELPPGTAAQRWSFPARNRIMAGLARMTLVVEAADPSGSLITAEFARDLGRAVAAVPGRVTARMAAGANGLLRDGAIPVTSIEDVLDELYGVGIRPRPPLDARRGPPADPGLRAVLDAVEAGSGVDEIVARTRASASEVRVALGRLEADGHVVRGALGGWERAAM
jgi:DNA processing protein